MVIHLVQTNRPRKFLRYTEDNFMVQVLRVLIKHRYLHLLFLKRECFLGEVMIGECLGHGDHGVVEF